MKAGRREDEWIDAPYFDGLEKVFTYLTDDRYPTDLRITTIECTANCTDEETRVLEVCWSQASTGLSRLQTADIAAYIERTPLFVEGDTLLMTEAFMDYTPLVMSNFIPPRPRIAGQIKFNTGATDGTGNIIFQDCFNNV